MMKTVYRSGMAVALVAGLMAMVPLTAKAGSGPVKFRAEVKPIGGIASPDIDGLGVRYTSLPVSYSETLDGTGSYMGTAQIGVEIDANICFIDMLVGGGFSANGGFAGGLLTGDIGCRFKLDNKGALTFGPFIGVVTPADTEWEVVSDGDEGTIDLNGNSGIQGGMKLSYDWEYVGMVLQVGYAQYGYDLSTDNPASWEIKHDDGAWTSYNAADKEVEMDGFFGQFGVVVRL